MTPAEKEARLYTTRFIFRRLGYVSAIAGGLVLAYLLRGVLVPLFLAFLLAYALDPLVDRLERSMPRALAALLVMLGMTGVVAAVMMIAGPYFVDELADAAAALPAQVKGLRERLDPWVWDHMHVRLPRDWAQLQLDYGDRIKTEIPEIMRGAIPAVFGTFNFVVVLAGSLIIPVFALYLLMDFHAIVKRASVLIPRRYASMVTEVARDVHVTLGRYVRGQVTACLLLALIYALGLHVLGIRLAVPIGVLTGLFAFVPYIGFGFGMVMALTMAILDFHGAGTLVGVVGVMLVGQVIDGLIITPRIVGGSVGLKPIEVLLTMMAAATLFGFLGILLAVPLGAVVKILVVRATQAYLRSPYYRAIPPAQTPTPLPGVTPLDPRSTRSPPPPSTPPS